MRVSVVDDTGNLLASGAGNGAEDMVAGELEERHAHHREPACATASRTCSPTSSAPAAPACRFRPSST